jgi:murein DD-endopeptidase MepM/ murein hydrolase activator NlpD
VNENSAFDKLKSEAKNYYKVYEVYGSKENDESVYYNSIEEAQNYIDLINSKYSDVDDEFKINTLYVENEVSDDTIKQAKAKLEESLNEKVAEINKQKEIDSKTINGVYIASVPVSNGHITSRFGSRESIRNHTHKGIDIAASYGTDIKAVADGTIEYASYNSGGYGNLVIIDHGNGIKTYYGHCSKLCVSVGQKVNAGDEIAKVGSTGNSTGSHCHFEIRVNGTQINPQKYVY